jgi:hypothetical protein
MHENQNHMNHKIIFASLTALVIAATSSFAQDTHKSGPFQGTKVNKGFVTHTTANGKSTLTAARGVDCIGCG